MSIQNQGLGTSREIKVGDFSQSPDVYYVQVKYVPMLSDIEGDRGIEWRTIRDYPVVNGDDAAARHAAFQMSGFLGLSTLIADVRVIKAGEVQKA